MSNEQQRRKDLKKLSDLTAKMQPVKRRQTVYHGKVAPAS